MMNQKNQTNLIKNTTKKTNNALIMQINKHKATNTSKFSSNISLKKDEDKHCTLNDLRKSQLNSPKHPQTTKNDKFQTRQKSDNIDVFATNKNIKRNMTNNMNFDYASHKKKSGKILNKLTFNSNSFYKNNSEEFSKTLKKNKVINQKNLNNVNKKNNEGFDFLGTNDFNELNFTEKNDRISVNETKISRISSNPFFSKENKNSYYQDYVKDINYILSEDSNKKVSVINFGSELRHCTTYQNNLKFKDLINDVTKNAINNINMETGENYLKLNNNSYHDSFTFNNPNTTSNESLYHNYLLMSKKGDKDNFLEELGKILSLPQKLSNIDYKDENGNSALHYSCDQGNLKIVEILINANANLNIRSNSQMTPLHLSTKRGFFDITKLLIEHGANIDVIDNEKNTPLHYICMNNHIELLKYFLGKNPKIDLENIYKKKPIDLTNNKEMKQLIIDYKKNYSKKNSINSNNSPQKSKIKIHDFSENGNILVNNTQNNININIQTNTDKEDSSNTSNKQNKTKIFNIKKDKFKCINSNIIINLADDLNYSYNESKNLSNFKNQLNKSETLNNTMNNKKNINNKSKQKNNINLELNCNPFYKKIQKTKILDKNYIENKNTKIIQKHKMRIDALLKKTTPNKKNKFVLKVLENNNNLNSYGNNNTYNNINNNSNISSNPHSISFSMNKNTKAKNAPKKIKKNQKINNNNNNTISSINNNNCNSTYNFSMAETQLIKTKEEKISPSNFICLALLGKGSFGEVYLVQNKKTKENYAMKVLRKERIINQNLLKYVIAERNVLGICNHPFIVKLNYAFQTPSILFLILEYCPGGDLAKHLYFEKKFEESRAKFYICEIILALENLHKRNIIFRDLKPDNVVLDSDGHCKLTDFGLSKEGIYGNLGAKTFCGSIAYLAPEMLKKQEYGKAVDWYLLGVLFYEMLVGVTPYFNGKKEDIFYNIQFGELNIPNFISNDANDLLKKLLERDPSKRLGGKKDAIEVKEHCYFKDVNWDNVYNKKYQTPHINYYCDVIMHVYHKPRLLANGSNNKGKEEKNMIEGWSFINNDEK